MRSFADVIFAFGPAKGESNLTKVLKKPDSHIRTLIARDSIPPEYWPRLIEAAPQYGVRGLTYELLAKLRTRRFGRAA